MGSRRLGPGAMALGHDTGPTVGSGVGQRFIPEEPMVRLYRLLCVVLRS
jgi:hypothetical protein